MVKIPLARYRLRFQLQDSSSQEHAKILQSRYLGSAWRGMLGMNLKKTVCVTRAPVCDNCPLLYSCPYPQIFEHRPLPTSNKLKKYTHAPNPYVLEPRNPNFDENNNSINLGLVLIGKANQSLPYIVYSFHRIARHGLTMNRIKLELTDVQIEQSNTEDRSSANKWEVIYEPNQPLISVSPSSPVSPHETENVKVHLITPLRLKVKGNLVVAEEFSFQILFGHLLRRLSLLSYFFSDTPLEVNFKDLIEQSKAVRLYNQNLKWMDWTRHSSRQKAYLQMGGIVGSFELRSQEIQTFLPYLWVGQWTHFGKGCTMGLGRYIIQRDNESVIESNESTDWSSPLPL